MIIRTVRVMRNVTYKNDKKRKVKATFFKLKSFILD